MEEIGSQNRKFVGRVDKQVIKSPKTKTLANKSMQYCE